MARVLALFCLTLLTLFMHADPASAQGRKSAAEISTEVEDDKGFLTRFLEEHLSGAGRTVSIDGFHGALSSRASFDRLTISDENGVWIEIENGAIQWNRSALLLRRIEIAELSAETIRLPRLPEGGKDAPKPEAPSFSLPELPVALNIQQIDAGRVEIGEPVFGQEAAVSVAGSMSLKGGEGEAKLDMQRVDGQHGAFLIDAAYSNATTELAIDVKLDEAPDGIFVNLVNLEGKPAVTAEIKGNGPMDDFTAEIKLATDGEPRIAGNVAITAQAASDGSPGISFRAELGGDVASLMAEDQRAFFGKHAQLLAEGWRGDDGRLNIPKLSLETDALKLSGSVATNAQSAPVSAEILLTLGSDAGAEVLPVRLPLQGDPPVLVQGGRLQFDYDAAKGSDWTLKGTLDKFDRDGLQIETVGLNGSGEVRLDDGALAGIDGEIGFDADTIQSKDPALASAVGPRLDGKLHFDWSPGAVLELTDIDVAGDGYGLTGELRADGLGSGITLSGRFNTSHDDLTKLAGLAGRPLKGSVNATIEGYYIVLTRGFDVDVKLDAADMNLGQEQLDRLLRGDTAVTLSARRDEDGVELRKLAVRGERLTADAGGTISSVASDLTATIELASLAEADPSLGGSLEAEAKLKGASGARQLTVNGHAMDLATGIDILDGALKGRTDLTVKAAESEGRYVAQTLHLANPQVTIQGEGDLTPGEMDAQLALDLPNLAVLGRDWAGSLSLSGHLAEDEGVRHLTVDGTGEDLRFGPQDPSGATTGTTKLALVASQGPDGIVIERGTLNNKQIDADVKGRVSEADTDLAGHARVTSLAALGQGWAGSLDLDGSFRDTGDGARHLKIAGTAKDVAIGQPQVDGMLRGESRLSVEATERDGVFTIGEALLDNPQAHASATGKAGGGATDLSADLRADSLAFLGRGFGGALTATGHVRQDGPDLAVTASGDARNLSVGNAQADTLLRGTTRFDLDASRRGSDIVIGGLKVANPQASLDASGSLSGGVTLDARLVDLGQVVPSLKGAAEARGVVQQSGNLLVMDVNLSGPGGTRASVRGSMAQNASTADLHISGTSDAAIANPMLRVRSVDGPVNFDLRLNGKPSLEALSGRVTLPSARLSDPKLGMRIEDLNLTADLGGGAVTITGGGRPSAGGSLAVNGRVGLEGARPLDLTVRFDDAVLRDPSLYETKLRGTVSVSGSLAAGPMIGGTITLGRTEIRIPSTGLGGAKDIPAIEHLGDRPPVRATRARAGLVPYPSEEATAAGLAGPPATPPANPARLNLRIDAPNQIFIRGRGVDAEMGGTLRITGNAHNVVPIGYLQLIRGRVDLLGKRFDLDEGLLEMQGSLVPVIRLVAETEQDGILTRITIEGEADDPKITFSAVPEMPQEEVLSHLLFGRGLDHISALQAAQLASAVATLAGKGGDGIVSRLRNQIGLDDLDLATDDEGNVTVRAGKYLTDNVYTDVAVAGDGKTKLNLNLDVTKSLTARGSIDNEGDSGIGLFYEHDY